MNRPPPSPWSCPCTAPPPSLDELLTRLEAAVPAGHRVRARRRPLPGRQRRPGPRTRWRHLPRPAAPPGRQRRPARRRAGRPPARPRRARRRHGRRPPGLSPRTCLVCSPPSTAVTADVVCAGRRGHYARPGPGTHAPAPIAGWRGCCPGGRIPVDAGHVQRLAPRSRSTRWWRSTITPLPRPGRGAGRAADHDRARRPPLARPRTVRHRLAPPGPDRRARPRHPDPAAPTGPPPPARTPPPARRRGRRARSRSQPIRPEDP